MDKRIVHKVFSWLSAIQFVLSVWGVFIVVTTGQWAEFEERCSDECISCEWTKDLPGSSRKFLPKGFFETRGLEVDENFGIIHKTQITYFLFNLVTGLSIQFVYLGDRDKLYYFIVILWGLTGGLINGFTAEYAKERSDFFRDRAISEEKAVMNVESELILKLTFVRTRMHILMEERGLATVINDTVSDKLEQRSIVALDNIQRKLQRELEGITLTLTQMQSIHGVCYGEFETNMGCVTRKYYACIAGMSAVSSAMCFFTFFYISYKKFTTHDIHSDSKDDMIGFVRPELLTDNMRESAAIA